MSNFLLFAEECSRCPYLLRMKVFGLIDVICLFFAYHSSMLLRLLFWAGVIFIIEVHPACDHVIASNGRIHLPCKTEPSSPFVFCPFSLHFTVFFSISLSISPSGHEAKGGSEADKKYMPGERQVWINKEEVYSALPEREGWMEMWRRFFSPF